MRTCAHACIVRRGLGWRTAKTRTLAGCTTACGAAASAWCRRDERARPVRQHGRFNEIEARKREEVRSTQLNIQFQIIVRFHPILFSLPSTDREAPGQVKLGQRKSSRRRLSTVALVSWCICRAPRHAHQQRGRSQNTGVAPRFDTSCIPTSLYVDPKIAMSKTSTSIAPLYLPTKCFLEVRRTVQTF